MTNEFDARIKNAFDGFAYRNLWRNLRTAKLGDINGTVIVSSDEQDKKGKFYARENDNQAQLIQVTNNFSGMEFNNSHAGFPIIVGNPPNSNETSIFMVDPSAAQEFLGGLLPSQLIDRISMLTTLDRLYFARLQSANDGMKVATSRFHYRINNEIKRVKPRVLADLTSYVPTTVDKYKYVLVAWDIDNETGHIIDGSEENTSNTYEWHALTENELPNNRYILLGAVKLTYGDTTLSNSQIVCLQDIINISDGNSTYWTSLLDTPDSLVGKAGRFVTVSQSEDGLTFSDFIPLVDPSVSYIGNILGNTKTIRIDLLEDYSIGSYQNNSSGSVSVSSEVEDYEGVNAFDYSTYISDYWLSVDQVETKYIERDLGASYSISSYAVTSTPNSSDWSNIYPTGWDFQYWNGSSWSTIESQTSQTFTAYEKKKFTITPQSAQRFKLEFSGVASGNQLGVGQVDLYTQRSRSKLAQSFELDDDGYVKNVQLSLSKWYDISGNFTVHIYSDNSGEPNASLISKQYSISTLSKAWESSAPQTIEPTTIEFDTEIKLNANTTYWIILETDITPSTNYTDVINWHYGNESPFNFYMYAEINSTWYQIYNTNSAFYFAVNIKSGYKFTDFSDTPNAIDNGKYLKGDSGSLSFSIIDSLYGYSLSGTPSVNDSIKFNGTSWEFFSASTGYDLEDDIGYEPRLEPSSPNALDDEFDDSSLDVSWSWDTTPTYSLTDFASWLSLDMGSSASHKLSKTFQPGSSTEFGIELMLSGSFNNDGDIIELGVADSSNVDKASVKVEQKSSDLVLDGTGIGALEIIANGTFETDASVDWTLSNFSRNSTEYAGTYSLRKDYLTSAETLWVTTYARQSFYLSAGDYLLDFYHMHRQDNTETAYCRARIFRESDGTSIWTSDNMFINGGYAYQTWYNKSTTVSISQAGTHRFEVSTETPGNGWLYYIYIDNVSLKSDDLYTPVKINPLFLRLHRNTSDIYNAYISYDGMSWLNVYTSSAITDTIDKVFIKFQQTTDYPWKNFAVNYIRRYI